MAAKSTYLNNAILTAVLTNGTAVSGTATLYAALTTATPTIGETGATIVEPTDASYTRIPITSATDWAAIVAGSTSNGTLLSGFFGAGAATGAVITSIAIVDSGPAYHTAGNLLYFGDITGPPKTVNAGDTASIAIGALVVSET